MKKHIQEGDLLWQPSAQDIAQANLTAFIAYLEREHGLTFADYDALWAWSVNDCAAFWSHFAAYCGILFHEPAQIIMSDEPMPHTRWFVGASLNYAENIFKQMRPDTVMIRFQAEDQTLVDYTWDAIYQQVNHLATALRAMGVQQGDRVVNYAPNRPESIVALLAVASIGAIWSSCSPDFGVRSVLDRFKQIEPKVLIAVDGYQYGGKTYDRRAEVAELQANLPSLEQTILIPHNHNHVEGLQQTRLWDDVLAVPTESDTIDFAPVPFEHPLWILYSSGTTGKPKAIVHSHGGITLEHHKMAILHADLKADDRFFWYTSTGWMMWNYLVGALFSGASIIVYDGSPAYPSLDTLFQLAQESGMTYFGTSAAFIGACINKDYSPRAHYDLSTIRAVGSTGSPLTPTAFQWVYEHINDTLALESVSGGTDLCTAFVAGIRTKPIYTGEIQGAALGASVHAYNDAGDPVLNEVGELVITKAMPSMPIYFWNDADKARYLGAYFELFPHIWRHGDWIKFNQRGGCVIYGRSDSTINRQGIRMGTSEIYQAVEALPEIEDSLIIDLELLGRDSFMPLFVVLRDNMDLTPTLEQRIKTTLRTNVSPRHVPNAIFKIDQVPYTLSGKKMEVPVRKILLGHDPTTAINRGAMRNPESMTYFIDYAKQLNAKP